MKICPPSLFVHYFDSNLKWRADVYNVYLLMTVMAIEEWQHRWSGYIACVDAKLRGIIVTYIVGCNNRINYVIPHHKGQLIP